MSVWVTATGPGFAAGGGVCLFACLVVCLFVWLVVCLFVFPLVCQNMFSSLLIIRQSAACLRHLPGLTQVAGSKVTFDSCDPQAPKYI